MQEGQVGLSTTVWASLFKQWLFGVAMLVWSCYSIQLFWRSWYTLNRLIKKGKIWIIKKNWIHFFLTIHGTETKYGIIFKTFHFSLISQVIEKIKNKKTW